MTNEESLLELFLKALDDATAKRSIVGLAHALKADAFFAFVMDDECETLVPAIGVDSLPTGRGWDQVLESARQAEGVEVRGVVPWPSPSDSKPAVAIGTSDGVVVLVGLTIEGNCAQAKQLIPLFLAAAKHALLARTARTAANMSHAEALEAIQTRSSLDSVRRELSKTLMTLQSQNAELEASVALRDDFLSVAAHELRNPIHIIQGYNALLRRTIGQHEDVHVLEAIEAISNNSARMVSLLELLLDFARIQSGRFELEPEPFDLAQLLRDIAVDSGMGVGDDEGRVVITGDQRVPMFADSLRLHQVFANLINNGLKYSAVSDPVVVTVIRDEARVVVDVADRGIGIEKEDLAKIFEPFRRGEHAERTTSGTGLGLYVAKTLVEQHGGFIDVISTPGSGSRFVVSMPLIFSDDRHE